MQLFHCITSAVTWRICHQQASVPNIRLTNLQAERLSTSVPPQDAALSAAGAASSAMPHSSLQHAALAADPQGQPSDTAADPMSAVGSKRKRDDATVPRRPNPGEIYVQMHRAQVRSTTICTSCYMQSTQQLSANRIIALLNVVTAS